MKKILFNLLSLSLVILSANESKAQQTLIHYWHFNNLVNPIPTGAVSPSTLPSIKADFSTIDTNKAVVSYQILAGTVGNAKTYWDFVSPGDTINSRLGVVAGLGFRPRNPSDSMQLVFYIPSTGFQNLNLKWEVQRSSVGGGAPQLIYDYSIDSGATWKNSGLSITIDSTGYATWKAMSVSINNDALAYGNSKLIFRMRFAGPTNIGTSGNVRFDNFTVEGDPIPTGPKFYNIGQINTTNPTTGVADSLNGHYTIRGLVYGFNQRTPSAGATFLLRDNTGGVTVFNVSKTFGYTVTEGDSIVVPGVVQSFRGLIEFAPDTIIKIASGKTIKTPTIITTLGEANENDLVKMNNLVFYTTPSGANWPTASTNILCHTQNLTDTIIVRVLAGSALAGTALPSSSLFNVTGMVQQFSTSSAAPFAFNGYEILPRTASDILSGLAPPDAVTNITSTSNLTTQTFSWTKPSTYIDASMTTLVFIKSGNAITQGTPNKNAISYTANSVFGSGTSYQNDVAAKCVLNSDNSSITVTGLTQGTAYYALVYVARNTDSVYSTAAIANATTTDNLPISVTAISVTGTTATSATIKWTKPVGYDNAAHSTIVFVKADNVITAGTPTNTVASYTANTTFGSGAIYQNDAAAFCVFNNDTNTVTVSNLIQGKTYNVIVWVVRDADSKYATTPTIGSGSPLPPPPPPSSIKLIHYWNFNNINTGTAGATVANSFKDWAVEADYSSLDTAKAKIYYRTYPGTSDAYMTYWDAVTGDTTNQRMNAIAGNGMRTRNPSDSMQVLFYIPTSHYKNIKISYACQKSSVASGAYQQNYSYSIDGGQNWKTTGLSKTSDSTAGIAYTRMGVNFTTADTMAYNNPNLVFRIRFAVDPTGTIGNPAGSSGNNRFDNFAVEGDTTTVSPLTDHTGIFETTNSISEVYLYPNPSTNNITISTNSSEIKTIVIMNIAGQELYNLKQEGKDITVDVSNFRSGIYFVNVIEGNKNYRTKFIKN